MHLLSIATLPQYYDYLLVIVDSRDIQGYHLPRFQSLGGKLCSRAEGVYTGTTHFQRNWWTQLKLKKYGHVLEVLQLSFVWMTNLDRVCTVHINASLVFLFIHTSLVVCACTQSLILRPTSYFTFNSCGHGTYIFSHARMRRVHFLQAWG